MMPDLNGKWTGELIYDESFGRLANETLFFVVEISRQGDEFNGTSVDVDGIGMNPSEALIAGFLDEDRINFVKEYKSVLKTTVDPALVNPGNKKGSEISFSGSFNSKTNEFEGEWFSLSDFITFSSKSRGDCIGGIWRMRRDPSH